MPGNVQSCNFAALNTQPSTLNSGRRMNAVTLDHRLCGINEPAKIPAGLDAVVDGWIGRCKRRRAAVCRLREDAERVDALGSHFQCLSDRALADKLAEFRQSFRRRPKQAADLAIEALAGVREAAERRMGLRPYVVQLMGALALQRGFLAEMATGEGKTLTAGLAAVLAAWTGFPCHLVTENDYLAQRDAEWLQALYEFCGLRVGYVTGAMIRPERAKGHAADITYATSKELAADFLRDRLCLGELQDVGRRLIRGVWKNAHAGTDGVVMRGLHTAIVDEADSVLIDEAVTPLIISGAQGNDRGDEAYQAAWSVAARLVPGVEYHVDLRRRAVDLLPAGHERIAALSVQLPGFWRAPLRRNELITHALTARELFTNGKQYVVEEGKVVIVDEFTGRLMPMRKWRHGVHQAIEAKEGLEVSPLDETLARLSFQRFFRLFTKLSGMTGTAQEAAPEFWHIYRLPVVSLPTHRPCLRCELPDRVFADQSAKWEALVTEISRVHGTGQPLLIGTRNVDESERLAERLRILGLRFNLLNASRHREEAQIVAGAGERGRITVATNMAGRGTDIKLAPGVAELGGLRVLTTERHESRRIDRQLYGRAGRQGDPGVAQAFLSADDELLRRFTPSFVRRGLRHAISSRFPVANGLAMQAVAMAQRLAQSQAYRQRCEVLRMDTWLADSLSFGGSREH
jgi:preprotein translocase subunit SecA